MSKFSARQSGPAQAARPSAAGAKAENERYVIFRDRMGRLTQAARRAGRGDLADALADLTARVEDREITLEEGQAELRHHEAAIRAMLAR